MTQMNHPESQLAKILAQSDILAKNGIAIEKEEVELLDNYRELLWERNRELNLTRHTTFEQFVFRDILDTTMLAQQLSKGDQVLDLGSGGGVPGVLLAILRPDLELTLTESVRKKSAALTEFVQTLKLPTTVHAGRAEDLLASATWHGGTVVGRAVAPLPKILTWLAPHWRSFERLLLVKGRRWPSERGEARHRGLLTNLQLRKVATYRDPFFDAESVILELTSKLHLTKK